MLPWENQPINNPSLNPSYNHSDTKKEGQEDVSSTNNCALARSLPFLPLKNMMDLSRDAERQYYCPPNRSHPTPGIEMTFLSKNWRQYAKSRKDKIRS